jgi:small subunit ribosomal protein S9
MEKNTRYVETVGRRKTSVARARLSPATKLSVSVNGRAFENYFPVAELRQRILDVLGTEPAPQSITIVVKGGGVSSQANAVRHAVARALASEGDAARKVMKEAGYLKRDPRAKERRKFGLKKARKAPQWSKR